MSIAMPPGTAPTPASTSPAPRFMRTGLPLTSGEVAGNIRQQKSNEKAAWSRAAIAAAAKGDPLCTSNVARLFQTRPPATAYAHQGIAQ